jgi:glycerophosphoryl diester phosphodiesterase/peptidoglycan hydrolase-like protein with peptidoglycan-binding domain
MSMRVGPSSNRPQQASDRAQAARLGSDTLSGDPTLEAVARGEKTLGRGASGPAVQKLQTGLVIVGRGLGADGAFGPKTEAGLKGFQKDAGLPQTGKLDAATLKALDHRLEVAGMQNPYVDSIDTIASLAASPDVVVPAKPPAPGTRPAAPEPTSYDNWFTDADQLQAPADVRRYLDHALKDGSHDAVRALRQIDINLATPQEKAKLIGVLLDGHTSGADENWILEQLKRSPAESGKILDALHAQGKLAQLFDDFQGKEAGRLLALAPVLVQRPETAASVVAALAASDTRERRLAAHHVFDQARSCGFLDQTLAQLRKAHGSNPVVNELVSQAKPTRTPVVYAHRGLPTKYPENTMPAIRAAVEKAGANGIEIDITLTEDDQIVLWHDYSPGGVTPLIRNLGMEPGMGFRPIWPDLGHAARKPIHELNLSAVRANMGYAPRSAGIGTSQRADAEIPTLDQVAAYAKAHPELEKIVLDVKLPPDRPDLHKRFGQRVRSILEAHGLEERVVVLHNDAGTVRNLKNTMGSRYDFSHDVEIVSLAPSASDYSAVDSANRLGNTVASVGRPRIGIDGYDTYLEVLKKDRKRIDQSRSGQDLVTWTINDELEMREILAIGVDGMLTDRPELLKSLLKKYNLE